MRSPQSGRRPPTCWPLSAPRSARNGRGGAAGSAPFLTNCGMSSGARMARDPYRRQIRRTRRAMRKCDNPFQVIVIGPDEPLGLIALAVISRWAWRHRTAFAPFEITIAAFAVAAFTHPHHARYWLLVAGT